MSFIDSSYFIAELNIPNTGNQAVAERLQFVIDKYEPLFLQKLLGYPLYKAFMAVTPPTDARLLSILNGAEFTDWNGYLQKWPGLINGMQSPIANYVYYWYQRSLATQSSGAGELKPQVENAKTVTARAKMTSAWNEMSDAVTQLTCFLQQSNLGSSPLYPEWTSANQMDALQFFNFMNPFF